MNRREFIAAGALAAAGTAAKTTFAQPHDLRRTRHRGRGAVVIASGNGLECVRRAHELINGGADPAHAVVKGVEINENDPRDDSVGYGGLPNEHGVVSLDACVMHGPTHRSGAVAAIENIKNPAAVALEVARRTDHCMIVGEGAKRFAVQMGFKEENLLTEESRRAWLRWKANHSRRDDWLNDDEHDIPGERGRFPGEGELPHTTGTIHCSALTGAGDLAGCTTTSGLSWKIPGRIGDSPLIGAGCYTDNAVGSAGATGRGEAVIQVCGARLIVMRMEMGDEPTEACLYALRHIAERTHAARLLNEQGQPNFNVIFYAVRKDGLFGSACMRGERTFAVADTGGARLERCAALYE